MTRYGITAARGIAGVIAVCFLLLFVRTVSAEAAVELETADSACDLGVRLMKEERFVDALRAFERAHSLSPTRRTLAQRGLAEQALHLWLAAETHLVGALRDAEDPGIATNRESLIEAVHEVRRHIGSVILQLEPRDADVQLTVAERVVPWPGAEPLRLPEGEIVLDASAAGFIPWRRRILMRPGALLVIPLVLEREPPRTSTPPLAQAELDATGRFDSGRQAASPPSWVAIGMMLAGAAAVVAGGYLVGRPNCGGAGPSCHWTDEPRLTGLALLGSGAAIGSGGIVLATW